MKRPRKIISESQDLKSPYHANRLHFASKNYFVNNLFLVGPVINIAVASQNDGIVQGFKHGFRGIFGHAAVKGQYTAHAHARLPIGFDAGVKATVEMLNNLTPIKFDFNGSYITVATEVFLTELEQGRYGYFRAIFLFKVYGTGHCPFEFSKIEANMVNSPCLETKFSHSD